MSGSTTSQRVGDIREARKRSVDNLQRLYTVVVSLAVTEMLKRILLPPPGTGPAGTNDYLMAATFLITVVPFYHGANRYLDATYVTGERSAKYFGLIVDFIFLFIEGIIFFALAVFVGKERQFYNTLVVLLLLDIVWVGSTVLTGSEDQPNQPHFPAWATINAVSAGLVWVFAESNVTKWQFWPDDLVRNISLTATATVRTVLDYKIVWPDYYPKNFTEERFSGIPAPPPAAPPADRNADEEKETT
jgi:hypothetical protein